MINNLPGPDQGLLDALFSKNTGETPQAVIPESEVKEFLEQHGGEPKALQFLELLRSSQDQRIQNILPEQAKEVVQGKEALSAKELVQSKDLVQPNPLQLQQALEKEKPQTTAKAMPFVAAEASANNIDTAQLAEKANIQKARKEKDVLSKDDKIAKSGNFEAKENQIPLKAKQAKVTGKGEDSNIDFQGAQSVAVAQTKALASESRVGKTEETQEKRAQLAKNLHNVRGEEMTGKVSALKTAQLQQANVLQKQEGKQQENLVSKYPELQNLETQVDEKQAMPMPVPVQTPLKSSADFLTERQGAVLGVNRPDPRLITRKSELKTDEEHSEDAKVSLENMSPNPELGLSNLKNTGMRQEPMIAGMKGHENVQKFAPAVFADQSSKVDAYNSMNLASEVNRIARQGGGAVKMKLVPEELGEMTVTVTQSGGGKTLNVKFETSNKEARDVLLSSVNELKEALHSSNFNVESIGIDVAANKSSNHGSSLMDTLALDRFRSDWMNELAQSDTGRRGNDSSGNNDNSRSNQNWNRYQDQSGRNQERGQWPQRGYRYYQDAELNT